ncbi:MAG: hypothetical protein J6I50_12255 [Clostridia bacterium]|nr:hypothetical protein [Clostridia bacterium]
MKLQSLRHTSTAAFLLLAVLAITASSCGDRKDTETKQTETITTAAVTEEIDPLPDNLPERDFGGYEFQSYVRSCCPSHKDGLWQEDSDGDVIDIAVFERNKKVENRFNCIIAEPKLAEGEDITVLQNSLLAADYITDIAVHHFRFLGDLALQQLLADMNTMEYLDFSQPWWNKDLIENYSIFDKVFVGYGTIDSDNITNVSVLYYNKHLANEKLDINFYDTVKNGEWTIDKMDEIIHEFGTDLNGDGKIEYEKDELAFTANAGYMFQYQVAMDQKTTKLNDAGEPELCINTEKMTSIVDKMYHMICDYPYSIVDNDTGSQAFIDGRSLFLTENLGIALKQLREMKDDYGIIPLPKYDKEQDRYYSHASAHANCMSVPIINSDFERVGIILEALAAEGYKIIRPAVYDVALKQKGARDEASAEMIDLICAGRTGDFADLYDEWGLVYTLDHMIGRQKNNNFASYYAKNEKTSINRLKKAVKAFASFEE